MKLTVRKSHDTHLHGMLLKMCLYLPPVFVFVFWVFFIPGTKLVPVGFFFTKKAVKGLLTTSIMLKTRSLTNTHLSGNF